MTDQPDGSRPQGTLGVGASTFRDLEIGCLGATLLVLFTAAVMLGLVMMVWWSLEHPE